MAMEINGNLLDYSVKKQNYNAYGNTYAAQKQQEVSEMAAQKNPGTESGKAKSTAEYMKGLEKLAPSVEFRIGNSYATDKTGKTLTINPKLLEKMQNDPAMEKKMKELIGGVEKMTKIVDNYQKAVGFTTVYHHSYIDANGKYSCIAFSVRKDKLNEKLRKEAEENAKKQIEKTRENARKKAEQLAEQLEEKAEETKKTEDSEDQGSMGAVKSDTARDKAEKLLSGKLENAGGREIYFNDDDMKIFMEAAKEEEQKQPDKGKNPAVAGSYFDRRA